MHFDPDTMGPLFENEGFKEALRIYREISSPCPESQDENTCVEFGTVNMAGSFKAGPLLVMGELGQAAWLITSLNVVLFEHMRKCINGKSM